jgi:hypothetical protein
MHSIARRIAIERQDTRAGAVVQKGRTCLLFAPQVDCRRATSVQLLREIAPEMGRGAQPKRLFCCP